MTSQGNPPAEESSAGVLLSRTELSALAAAASFCGFAYAIAVSARLSLWSGGAPLWRSLTPGLYLAAAGAGASTAARLGRIEPWPWLWGSALALAATGASCVAGIRWLGGWAGPAALPLGEAFAVATGFLCGFQLRLLLRLAEEAGPRGEGSRWVLGAACLGPAAASLASAKLLHALGPAGWAAAASAIHLAACCYLFRGARAGRYAWGGLAAVAAAWLALSGKAPGAERREAAALYRARMGTPGAGLYIERVPSGVQRVDLVTHANSAPPFRDPLNTRPSAEPGLPYQLWLFLDRRFRFYGAREALNSEFLAHVPAQLFGRVPRDVLILGGGDGLLAKELLKYGERVRRVVVVDRDPALLRLAADDERLSLLNAESLRDPKVELVAADAFEFVRQEADRFDAVYIAEPDAAEPERLHTEEFLRGVARRLKPRGYGAMLFPLASAASLEREPEDRDGPRRNTIAAETLSAAGFATIVPYDTECPELAPYYRAFLGDLVDRAEDEDRENARLLRLVETRRFLRAHPGTTADLSRDYWVVDNAIGRAGVLAFTRLPVRPDFRFKDYGIPLYSLNAERLRKLQDARFPMPRRGAKAHSVVRPAL